jgi:hypothetical protein
LGAFCGLSCNICRNRLQIGSNVGLVCRVSAVRLAIAVRLVRCGVVGRGQDAVQGDVRERVSTNF